VNGRQNASEGKVGVHLCRQQAVFFLVHPLFLFALFSCVRVLNQIRPIPYFITLAKFCQFFEKKVG